MLGLDEPATIYQTGGCNACSGSGFSGRIGIHEILVLDKDLRSMIIAQESLDAIKETARKKGMWTLSESCRALVLDGTTNIDEMMRVTYSVDD